MFGNIHDTLFLYRKSNSSFIWKEQFEDKNSEDFARLYEYEDKEDGRRYTTVALHAPGVRKGETGTPWRGKMPPTGRHWAYVHTQLDEFDKNGYVEWSKNGNPRLKKYADESFGNRVQDVWTMKDPQYETYPTEKTESLISRLIEASSNPGSIVFDCFMGSGTTQAVAMKLGRRFIGADINLGAIHTTVKRLNKVMAESEADKKLISDEPAKYLGFQVYHVNNYEIFKNPIEAKSLLVEALELDPYPAGHLYDGQKDGRQYKRLCPSTTLRVRPT